MCQAHYGSALYVLVNNRSYFRNEAIKQIQNEHNHHHPPTTQTSTWQCHLHAFE